MTKTRRIGLAVDAVAEYGRGVLRGVMAFCRAHPHWLVTEEPRGWNFEGTPRIANWDVDGLIVQVYSEQFEREVLSLGKPATNVSNFVDTRRLPTIVPDDVAIGAMGVDYLRSLGFRELGFVWCSGMEFARLRLESFRYEAASKGLRVHEFDATHQDMSRWLVDIPKPAGVMACNDDWAHRVLKAARRLGIKVPDHVAVLGVDNDELMNTLVRPSISSIAVPAEQVGYEAAVQLEKLMDGKDVPVAVTRLKPVRVVTKESTEIVAVDDPDVTTALQYIREHSSRPIQVDDLMDKVALSRRSLERKFRAALGRSILAEIQESHIARAKQLLITTDLSIKQVAAASGFVSATRFGIVFCKSAGQPPSEYRRRARLGIHRGSNGELSSDASLKAARKMHPH